MQGSETTGQVLWRLPPSLHPERSAGAQQGPCGPMHMARHACCQHACSPRAHRHICPQLPAHPCRHQAALGKGKGARQGGEAVGRGDGEHDREVEAHGGVQGGGAVRAVPAAPAAAPASSAVANKRRRRGGRLKAQKGHAACSRRHQGARSRASRDARAGGCKLAHALPAAAALLLGGVRDPARQPEIVAVACGLRGVRAAWQQGWGPQKAVRYTALQRDGASGNST